MSARRRWSDQDNALLRELYPHVNSGEIAQRLGRTLPSTYSQAKKLGLGKSEAYLASPAACRLRRGDHVGAAYQFAKGHAPANKGLRRPGFGPGQMKATQFEKGQSAHNWKPIGTERLVDGYRYTKVSDQRCVPWTANWRPTHVLTWESAHGQVPPGHALAFHNRDRMDTRLENLALITRAELMRRNTVHNLPAPLPQTIQLLGALKRKINRRSREEQDRGLTQSPVRDAGSLSGSGEANGDRQGESGGGRGTSAHRLREGRGAAPRGDGPDEGNGLHHTPRGRRATDTPTARGGLVARARLTRRATQLEGAE